MTKNKIEKIARTCHQVNKVYCESLGDFSQKDWDDMPYEIQESAMNGVLYHLNNEVTPEQSHINWCKFKLENGWIYGKEKDFEKKTHPCLVDYKDLPKEQQVKDKFFTEIVKVYK